MSQRRNLHRSILAVVLLLFLLPAATLTAAPAPGTEAHYLVQRARESEPAPWRGLRMRIESTEMVDGAAFTWWSLTVESHKGERFGVRMLSEGVPLTRSGALGEVAVYQYADARGGVTEYLDEATGRALLPSLEFESVFLPRASEDARFVDGLATAGVFLGHPLVRTASLAWLEPLTFEGARPLELRPDLLIAAHVWPCLECAEDDPKRCIIVRCSESQTRTLIDAGYNFFAIHEDEDRWLIDEPVFFRNVGDPPFPDWFYRSNFRSGDMFIDEPSIRFGWDDHIPRWDLLGPEQLATALRERIREHYSHRRLRVDTGPGSGTLDLYYNPPVSWDTHYFSAWQTLAAGAPGIIYEGRYNDYGYGWSPTFHFGDEGLEGLTLEDQFNCVHAFMSGAARAFGGDWGTSIYQEGNPAYSEAAFKHAYDRGARFLWFWMSLDPSEGGVNFDTIVGLARAMKDHARSSPRVSAAAQLVKPKLGIVLPAGYTYEPGSIFGFRPNQATPAGATYGDVASAVLWEGILASMRGEAFDYLNDDPRIRDLGYERLLYVRPDARVEAVPPRAETRPAGNLRLSWEPSEAETVASRMDREAEYVIPRGDGLVIDGELDDWADRSWIDMGRDVRGTLQHLEFQVDNTDAPRLLRESGAAYLGFECVQLDTELQLQHHMEDYYVLGDRWIPPRPGIREEKIGVLITTVTPGGRAEQAGLRVGDVVDFIEGKQLKAPWMIGECLPWFKDINPLTFKVTRSGHEFVGAPGDLGGAIALAVDEGFLYVAARVTDDIHQAPAWGNRFWESDSVHIALDTVLGRGDNGYLENDHEIAFALYEGRPVAWRSQGRTGQLWGEMDGVRLAVVRGADHTRYEAAIPLSELLPLAPDLWGKAGFCAAFVDNDGRDLSRREGRLELREGAMTRGKNGDQFPVFAFAPGAETEKVSAALFWKRRATPEDGFFRLVVAARSPETRTTRVLASLQSLDSPQTPAAAAWVEIPVAAEPAEMSLRVETDSPPGRYALQVWVEDGRGGIATSDRLPVYVYPARRTASGE